MTKRGKQNYPACRLSKKLICSLIAKGADHLAYSLRSEDEKNATKYLNLHLLCITVDSGLKKLADEVLHSLSLSLLHLFE